MRAEVTIKLETGQILSGVLTSLDDAGSTNSSTSQFVSLSEEPHSRLDFTLPLRPFMLRYSAKMSGSKKFALLVAYYAKGETDVAIDRSLLIEQWNKMTGLLGGKFNGAHESRAKDSGWIYVPDSGSIALIKDWEKILL